VVSVTRVKQKAAMWQSGTADCEMLLLYWSGRSSRDC
jgi:hypothetical protein